MNSDAIGIKDLRIQAGDVRPLSDIVYEKLKYFIIVGNFAPGERISERKLSEHMGISTTTIKRALHRLNVEGLVEIRPRKGTYVSRFYLSSIEEIGIIRAALEGVTAKLAAAKVTDGELAELRRQIGFMEMHTESGDLDKLIEANSEFHRMIREIARNLYISQLIKIVHSFDNTVRRRALMDPEEAGRGINEHRAIFQAIADRNGDLAEGRIKEHILRTSQFVVREIKAQILKKEGLAEQGQGPAAHQYAGPQNAKRPARKPA
jgi:DNA-binding GntR family transcriptional regulator